VWLTCEICKRYVVPILLLLLSHYISCRPSCVLRVFFFHAVSLLCLKLLSPVLDLSRTMSFFYKIWVKPGVWFVNKLNSLDGGGGHSLDGEGDIVTESSVIGHKPKVTGLLTIIIESHSKDLLTRRGTEGGGADFGGDLYRPLISHYCSQCI